MASNFLAFHTIGVRASAARSNHHSSETSRRNPSLSFASPPSPTASNWWSPLFGWSSDPDYIDSNSSEIAYNQDDSLAKTDERDANSSRSKFAPGGFTEEKARRLRMMTTGNETFHDVMYHSSIASRLASDFSRRSDR